MKIDPALEEKAINTIRFLSADAVQKANSGHPGLPMGTAAIAYTIWTKHLKHNPANPKWFDRDRFVLSGGHGSMLLYALLHLTGYDLSLEDIKQFRQWGSRTPGHPEVGITSGVEVTTGPLGQGFANGVGMAIAEAHLGAEFNPEREKIIDHHVYAIVTDGDLMEGVTSEAASLAGTLGLGKLIYCYDDNGITIDGSTSLAFTEDVGARFESYGWQVLRVKDGNNVSEIDKAIKKAKKDPRPSLIICKTHIGYGLPTRQDTAKAHGEPPGAEELAGAKVKLGWPAEPDFLIPEEVKKFFAKARPVGKKLEAVWKNNLADFRKDNPEKAIELIRRINSELPALGSLPIFPADKKGLATRAASGKVLNALAEQLPEIIGGSADLTPSNNTWLASSSAFSADNPLGRYIYFGVREHAMGSIINGIAAHGGLVPYCATFFVFSDYLRPALRLASLSGYRTIWIFTHDSVGLGEDGPTHQPIEHLASLRAMPGLTLIRPADANETRVAWEAAVKNENGPTALILSRQALPILDREKYTSADGLARGAYVLADLGKQKPQIALIASGSEVDLIVKAGEELSEQGVSARLISMPSWDLFEKQSGKYKKSVLPESMKMRIAIEAGSTLGWDRYIGDKGIALGIDHFGASAPGNIVLGKFGITVDNVVDAAKKMLGGGI